nr:DUF2232 domain-containing protein [Sedimentibacter sp.]
MNRNIKTSSMTEAAMISGILVLFAYISTFLISLLMFFYPIPAIILAKRRGVKYAVLSLAAADIIITMLLGIQIGISFAVLFSPLAIALSYGICKDENPNKTIMYGAIAFMVSFVAMILLMQFVMGINFVQQLVEMTKESFNMSKEMLLKTAGDTNSDKFKETLKYFEETGTAMVTFVSHQFPSMLISASVVTSAVNYFAVGKIAKRFSIDIRKHEGLSNFSFPNTFILAMAGLLLISYLLGVFKVNVNVIQMNLFMICYMAMFIQGFAVVKFYLIKWNVNKIGRTLILISILLMVGFAQILALVGIVDLVFDIRKIRRKIV